MEIKTCKICHCKYVPDLVEDIKLHKKYHDEFVYGIRANSLKSDDEISNLGDFKIILVSQKSSLVQRKRAERIALRAKRGTNYDFASYYADEPLRKDLPLVFVGVIKNRAIAMLVLRKTERAVKVAWKFYEKKDGKNIALLPDKRWKIAMIWTLEKERRKGFASRLINVASEYIGSPVSEIAWSTPFTKFGLSLAKSIASTEIILTA